MMSNATITMTIIIMINLVELLPESSIVIYRMTHNDICIYLATYVLNGMQIYMRMLHVPSYSDNTYDLYNQTS